MLFNSYLFILIFLPITLSGFFIIGGRGHHRVAIAWLVGASLFFYGWWNPIYVSLILFSILFNYAMGVSLAQSHTASNKNSKAVLIFGVIVNLGFLSYFKYTNFFVDSLNTVFSSNWHLENIVLPLAISFFTFQQIAYLVDAYRGETKEYNFLHYCLFVTFFPQLIAGPIVHHKEMLPQFARDFIYRLNYKDLAIGLTIFFIGLFKKVVIADNFATHATPVFNAAESGMSLSFFQAWEGSISYTMQIYFDFSGYSDMAIGLGRMFGIKLPVNFNSPYQATNIIDFWRRWHMTLSRFLRDYLYFPLGGNRKGRARRYANLMITMLLGGLWHGAGWTFVAWGVLHGVYLIINHAWQYIWKWRIDRWWSLSFARLITLFAVMIGWVFFRAESFEGAMNMLKGMMNLPSTLHGNLGYLENVLVFFGFGFDGGCLSAVHYKGLAWVFIWLFVLWVCPNTQQWMLLISPAIDAQGFSLKRPIARYWQLLQWRPTIAWGIITSFIAVAAMMGLTRISEFLYFQF
ncbi:MAG: MBOAT family protein [Candidatus Brocadiaceae bacterium]|nr:MBOAT family protein [Candidatus Brocadiaceae bacterium]